MEEAAELVNYLPISFKSPKEQEYIALLWAAFELNYTRSKHAHHGLRLCLLQHLQMQPDDPEI